MGNQFDGSVAVIDTATNTVIATVTVGSFPIGVAVNPAGTRVYVASDGDGTVSVIDTTTNTVVDTVVTGVLSIEGLAVSPDGTRVYLANCDSDSVSVLDTATNTMGDTIPVGTFAEGVALNPSGTRAYVTNRFSDDVSVIDTTSNTVTATIGVGTGSYGVAVNPAGTRVYVANNGGDSVSVIDTATGTVMATVSLDAGASPTGVAVTPDGTRVYVTATDLNNVWVIETAGNTVIDTVSALGSAPVAFGDFIGNGPAATHFTVSAPASATAGTAFGFTVAALDQFGNTAIGYHGTVHFTSTEGAATLPADATLTNGTGGFNATLRTSGTLTLTATDTVTAATTGTSNDILVSAAAATHFTVSASASATAGTVFSFTVTARDQFDNTATGYSGTVHFTSSDGTAILPANATLTNGTGNFNGTLGTVGNQTITGTDTVTASITGTSGQIAVSAVTTTTHFTLSAPASAGAGDVFTFTITARDQFNNLATGYGGTVHFTSNDPQATLPADTTLTNGTGTLSATLRTAGNRAIIGTDTVTASITGASGVIAVSAAAAASHLQISAPAVAGAGAAFSFTVTALDPFNNVATSYGGTIHFTSSDPLATLPVDSTLTNGVGSFGATLRTAGNQTIAGMDTVSSSITGASNAIVVAPAAATHFTLAAPASASGGIAFSFTVTARDQFDNVAIGYGGTVHFTSSDSQATLPPDSLLTNGTGAFSATLRTPGTQTITATDTVNGAITGSAAISSVAAIPTLGTWSFLLLALGLAAVAVRTLRLGPVRAR